MSTRAAGSIGVLGAIGLVALTFIGGATIAGVAIGLEMLRQDATLPQAVAALQGDVLLLSVCQLGGIGLAIGAGVIFTHGGDVRFRDALDVKPVSPAIVVFAITGGLALQFPLSELANILASIDPTFAPDEETQQALRRMVRIDSMTDAITVPLAIVAIPAVTEELLFRGLLLPGLSRRYNRGAGLVLSSVLFGAMHVMPLAIVYATLGGFALGLVRMRTGSVLAPIAMHGAFNAVPVLLPADIVRIEGFNTNGPDVYHLPLALTVGGALIAIASFVAMTRLSEPHEQS